MTDQELLSAAREAALGSYSPYSGFRVGAVVIADDGREFRSANVENAAYPVSQCAEANAINYAASHGVRKIDTVAVACIDARELDLAYPCGRCRQIMSEFDPDRILVTTAAGDFRAHKMDDLLPYRFSF
ncbi:MAG: cytidine deaminase [Acidimicrobiia bacterium]|nr:cytidine deaminase [Acidimicrobiia bacterium]